jgi:hypothetical protein
MTSARSSGEFQGLYTQSVDANGTVSNVGWLSTTLWLDPPFLECSLSDSWIRRFLIEPRGHKP